MLRSPLRPLLRPLLRLPTEAGYGGVSVDTDAAAWAAAVTANGGTYSPTTLAAVSKFAKSAKANGYWTKLIRINLFAGDQLAAALVPLKAGGGTATDTNMNFVSGDYSETTGLTGNGSTKYLKTGLVPSAILTLNDTHQAVYNRAASATGGLIHIGARDGTNFLELLAPNSDGFAYARAYDVNTVDGAVVAPYGLMVASRTAANAFSLYEHGVLRASSATSAGALVGFETYVFATNSSGAPLGHTSHPLGSYSTGGGLTAAEALAYSADMQTFQTDLGRNV